MTTALVGSGGYIAQYILAALLKNKEVSRIIKIDQKNSGDTYLLDLNNPEQFDYSILDKVDYLIFTAAVSSPDQCAEHYEKCWKINVMGTKYFIKNALEKGCKVIFFSSDAVFGDIPGKIYEENSVTDAKTAYGKMKKQIEDDFKGEQNFKAIRLSYVISSNDKFTSYCLTCMNRGIEAEIYHPFYRNCITVSDVLLVITWLLANWTKLPSSFLNLAGRELVSRVRISDEISRIYGGRLKYRILTPNHGFYENRPAITQMKSRYLYTLGMIEDRTFTEMIAQELEEMKR